MAWHQALSVFVGICRNRQLPAWIFTWTNERFGMPADSAGQFLYLDVFRPDAMSVEG
jgi:hypothetical protein